MPVFIPYRDERGHKPFRQDLVVTIRNGESISQGYVELDDCYTVVGIYMPAAWTEANIGFLTTYPTIAIPDSQVQPITGDVWQLINEPGGTDYVEIQVAAGEYTYIDPSILSGCRFLRIQSIIDGTPTAQGADRSVRLVVRPV